MFNSRFQLDLARDIGRDRRRHAERMRLRRTARQAARSVPQPIEPITIRHATDADLPAIAQIAELEERRAPAGRPLVAVSDGRMLAVLDTDTGDVLSDPFAPSEPSASLIRTYAASVRSVAA